MREHERHDGIDRKCGRAIISRGVLVDLDAAPFGRSDMDRPTDTIWFGGWNSDQDPDAAHSRRSNLSTDLVMNNTKFTHITLGFRPSAVDAVSRDARGGPMADHSVHDARLGRLVA